MQSQRRQSQIVNNFFTLVTIVVVTVVLSLYVKYGPKQQILHSNLECQKQSPTYDKVIQPSLLKKAHTLLTSGAYVLDGGIIKPRFGKSYFSSLLDIDQTDEYFKNAINIPQKQKNYVLKIRYELFENDKNDPRKKEEDKMYAGDLMSIFRINDKVIFKMKTRIKEYNKEEIKERIQCSVKAFKHNARK